MALYVLNPGKDPLGQFDGLDAEVTTLLGGEVVTFGTALLTADKGAADVADGYLNPGTSRVVVTKTLSSGKRPLMLADEGTTYYGTLFGTVVGGTVGQVATGGAVLGPHTATASGKVTCWDKPGLYGVSLDACDTSATTGLQPTNATLVAGAKLYATTAGLLTPNSASKFEDVAVGRFVEFRTNGALVQTPNRLVQALNSPTNATGPLTSGLLMAVFAFKAE